tara:strand:+ start:358 stop:888 length:531 start_codon:yes stop_codon:yes gene_type:complete
MSKEYEIIQPQMIEWKTWQPSMLSSLVFICRDAEVLLIRKKTGLGAGKINAPGGKIEHGENAETAAIREVEEEVKLKVKDLRKMGTLKFQFIDGSKLALHCTVFKTLEFIGEPEETTEATPFWCNNNEIPYKEMWADDICWLPGMLEGNCFEGEFVFEGDSMLWKDIRWHQIDQES